MWPGKVSTGIMYTRMPEAERKRVTSMALRYHDVRRAVGGSARPVEAEARDVLEVRRGEGPEGRPGPAQPRVRRRGGAAEAFPRLDGRADLRGGAPVAREGVHERRGVEVD